MHVYFFIITLLMLSFGGTVNIMVDAQTMAGCEKFHSLTRKQMSELLMKYEITECELKVLDFQKP